ncbi:MAG: VKORC1/thioredoxin domain protein [Candidatus Azambacteria bacterium GW2011_GWA2_42_9]|uniref:VKORC1/thioredoxin domain protein n=1 Tax=Candidatus Azambacteria bacterium GW2011_GWA2_42_9 TaxID=1618613 RepID=A0A0G1BNE8_9BACT|nr:MAG: VKORC1/thioredoxin domain protein [Candidatus Azambacteria bacterium GW2011_GWA2_42_9]
MNSKIIFIFCVIILVFAFLLLDWGKQDAGNSENALDTLAKCLASKKVVMYGAEWCSHCQNEKKAFGESFKFINYVECPQNPKQCLDSDIGDYPTWILGDGRKLVGEQGLIKLSRESGCPLP